MMTKTTRGAPAPSAGKRGLIVGATVAMMAALVTVTAAPAASAAPNCRPYIDVDSSNPHCENIAWLGAVGITKPRDGYYHPKDSVTRGAMAAFLYRIAGPGVGAGDCTVQPFTDVRVDDTFCGVISWMKSNGITYGIGDGQYGTTLPVTRQAMASFIHRIADPDRPLHIGDWMEQWADGEPVVRITVISKEVDRGPRGYFDDMPEPGHVFLIFDIKIEALSGADQGVFGSYEVNPYNWTVVDDAGYAYDPDYAVERDHELQSVSLAPGEFRRGQIAFDAPAHGSLVLDPYEGKKITWTF